ncbi:MAG: rRNA methyltransferase [Treponema sp.]|nr:rRNA methyltransferase [Treponema sp.]
MRNGQSRAASGGIAALPALIEETFPLPRRFRAGLPGDVAELSRLLTSAGPEREAGYLGRPRFLSAYLRYFLPWNVFRLHRVLSLDAVPLVLSDGDAITDLGSGPLTLPIALWLARPELRKLRLEFRCIDRTGAALDAGKKLFLALTEQNKIPQPGGAAGTDLPGGSGWIIKTIRGPLDTPVYGGGAKLVGAVNVFNEVYPQGPPGEGAEKAAALLGSLCAPEGAVFAMEPGNPRGGAFIAGLRSALLERKRSPLAPCPHHGHCPLPGGALPDYAAAYHRPGGSRGGKAKWCHFAFDTRPAPAALCRLSEEAGIPKERAAVSFLLAGPAGKTAAGPADNVAASSPDVKRMRDNTPSPAAALPADLKRIRVISDAFPLLQTAPSQWGRYGCSEQGLVLIAGNRWEMEQTESGSLLELPFPKDEQRDPKTGALIVLCG